MSCDMRQHTKRPADASADESIPKKAATEPRPLNQLQASIAKDLDWGADATPSGAAAVIEAVLVLAPRLRCGATREAQSRRSSGGAGFEAPGQDTCSMFLSINRVALVYVASCGPV